MKAQEAIDILSNCKDCKRNIKGECTVDTGCFIAKRWAIEALYRAEQKQAIKIDGKIYQYKCPACDKAMERSNYCPRCGQSLKYD